MLTFLLACTGAPPEAPATDVPDGPAASDLAPAWSAESCRTSQLRDGLVEQRRMAREGWVLHEQDLDGDGSKEQLRVNSSSGSGMATDELNLKVDESTSIEMVVTFDFATIRHEVAYPEGATDAAKALIEDALWGTSCPTPDPSLAHLLSGEVVWHEGPVVIPPFYAWPSPDGWQIYAGHMHANKEFPKLLAEQDGTRIQATAHGVYAERDGSHAWLYVDKGFDKLRHPTELAATLSGDAVEIVHTPSGADPITVTRTLTE